MFLESDNLASYKPSEFQISSPKLFIKHHLNTTPITTLQLLGARRSVIIGLDTGVW
jgi:hypothetical protein